MDLVIKLPKGLYGRLKRAGVDVEREVVKHLTQLAERKGAKGEGKERLKKKLKLLLKGKGRGRKENLSERIDEVLYGAGGR